MKIEIPVQMIDGKFTIDVSNMQSQLAEITAQYNKDMAGISELINSVIEVDQIKSVATIQKEVVALVAESEKNRVHTNTLKFIVLSKNFVFAEGKQGPKGKIESCIKRIK